MNKTDILNSRDLEERIDELEVLETDLDLDEDDKAELKMLRDFRAELENYCDWIHGEALIHADHFETYAEELAGALPTRWPLNHIDWEAAAADLKVEYTYAYLDGSAYYVLCN